MKKFLKIQLSANIEDSVLSSPDATCMAYYSQDLVTYIDKFSIVNFSINEANNDSGPFDSTQISIHAGEVIIQLSFKEKCGEFQRIKRELLELAEYDSSKVTCASCLSEVNAPD